MSEDLPRVRLWEYPRDAAEALRSATIVAQDELVPPAMEGHLVSSRGDHLTVQLVTGKVKARSSIVYVERRGTFEVFRVETWPGPRTLLVMRAWPSRA